jgi:diguanylate cyclase (GGDEF)-like protein
MSTRNSTGNLWAFFVALLMLGVTFVYWKNEEQQLTAKRKDGFTQAADQITLSIDRRLTTFELALRGVKGFIEGSDSVSRSEYRSYFQALQLRETQPGLQGVAIATLVNQADRDRHIVEMHERGFPTYRIHPEGERAQYTPITLIEPYTSANIVAIGFDIASNPQLEPTLRQARDTGAMALSSVTKLVQDAGKDLKAVVMYLPIYANGQPVVTLTDRRAAITGWVSGPFHVADLIAGLGKQLDSDIGIALYEGNLMSTDHVLYGDGGPVQSKVRADHLFTVRTLEVGGRQWTVAMHSLPEFEAKYNGEGQHRIVAAVGAVLSLFMGWVAWLLATGRERALTLAKAMTQELRAMQSDQEATLDAMPDVLFELDLDGRYYKCRTSHMNLLAAPAEVCVGKLISEVLPAPAADICLEALQEANLKGSSAGRQIEIPLGGEPYWFELSIARKAGGLQDRPHFIMISRDITERKQAESQIQALAFSDPLTGLPNRRLLMDRLDQALLTASRHEHLNALVFIDLDHFKTLNDTVGHDKGDSLLRQTAQRLVFCVRDGDTVARLGGDEFVVLLQDLSNLLPEAATQAQTVTAKILAALGQPYEIDGHGHHSTASIGVTLFGDAQRESIEEPLKRAELAMYQAKAAGRNTFRFFEPEMGTAVNIRAILETDLRTALTSDQFLLYYQPQGGGNAPMSGVEALLRWQHPQRGFVSPAEFIPIAETNGLILPMGRWVLETACNQLAAWALRPEMAHLTMAVNVSAPQFRQPDFVQDVMTILHASGARPERLKLELTESVLVDNVEDIIVKMNALKAKGVRFSIDDFGTGYSSLSYLKRLPLDQLKIDQGFVRDILSDPDDAAIAKMVIALADSLGLSVIAEGVETEAQRDFLASLGCTKYQGYLFSRPLPIQEFERFAAKVFAGIEIADSGTNAPNVNRV